MRDPEGELHFDKNRVFRIINKDSSSLLILRNKIFEDLIDEKFLIPYSFIDDVTLESPLLQFVSQPHEWSFEQLRDAGEHTLTLSKRICSFNMELKDASAWNILFDGCNPLFCDYLSFKMSEAHYWWAMGQFVRHFTLPLASHRKEILKTHQIFRLSRDGLSLDSAKKMLGYKIFFSRAFPFGFFGNREGIPVKENSDSIRRLQSIYEFLSWSIQYKESRSASTWSEYTGQRTHYSEEQIALKKETVTRWLQRIRPHWVTDIGCNTGEFSEIAARLGAKVICADHDDECISRLYVRAKTDAILNNKLHPIIFNFGDAIGSSGAGGLEFSSLIDRIGNVTNCLLLLGLLHHLLISESIPISMLLKIISKMTSNYVILELIDPEDVQHKLLCMQRNRIGPNLSISAQIAALSATFELLEEIDIIPGHRKLCLFKKI